MPRTAGDSRIPVDRIASFVPVDSPVVEYLHEPTGEVAEQIARYVARLIEDRSTLQVGLGRVPNEMLAHLTNRRELAIHSDVITEPIADLVDDRRRHRPGRDELGDGLEAPIRPRRRRSSVRVSPDRLRLRPGGHRQQGADGVGHAGVHHRPHRPGVHRKPRRRAVRRGIHGPAFHRGALASRGGMAIVCLASRTPPGRSAISLDLGPGEAVAIPRADVHWVVTEYGTAYLFGRSLAERAVALIEIAHPDFRKRAARRGDRARARRAQAAAAQPHRVPGRRGARRAATRRPRGAPAPDAHERHRRDAGAVLPARRGGRETRFFQKLSSLTDTAAQYLCSVDYEQEMAFAAVVGPRAHERIVAASSYYLSPATGLAEVAYMVDPEWQGAGLGRDPARGTGRVRPPARRPRPEGRRATRATRA